MRGGRRPSVPAATDSRDVLSSSPERSERKGLSRVRGSPGFNATGRHRQKRRPAYANGLFARVSQRRTGTNPFAGIGQWHARSFAGVGQRLLRTDRSAGGVHEWLLARFGLRSGFRAASGPPVSSVSEGTDRTGFCGQSPVDGSGLSVGSGSVETGAGGQVSSLRPCLGAGGFRRHAVGPGVPGPARRCR